MSVTPTPKDRSSVKLTYEDYCRIPDDGLRHEILDGEHYVSPAPETYHQKVSRLIQFQLMEQVEQRGRGEVYNAPTDVHLAENDIAQPDLALVLAEHGEQVTRAKIVGAPDLVVEILSPSTGHRDRGLKMRRYASAGVPEYWIVDPERRRIEQCTLEHEAFRLVTTEDRAIRLCVLPDVVVDLQKVW